MPSTCHLFSYFTNNGEDGLHLAWSPDGYEWKALNEGRSLLKPLPEGKGIMRDPCLMSGPDGLFRLVWTDGWMGRTIGYATSRDLVTWSEPRHLPVMEHEPTCLNSWAPEIFYDAARGHYILIWSSTIPGRFAGIEDPEENGYNHRLYATTTIDFQTFTPTTLFFDPGFNVIDATILPAQGRFYLIYKDERRIPEVKKNLLMAVSDKMEGPYAPFCGPITESWAEGPTVAKLGEDYVVYFDCYTRGRYGAVRSKDLKTWEDVSDKLSMPEGARHGFVLEVEEKVIGGLR